ncbi:Protein of unknown function [Pseudoxanthomonas wuyuanensis]|uniref:Acyltransferase 3 domain-containing protein n=2 Tax=Pseudoxanthomonas wuyuanensis TaxID=1073196 RepID=A0A286CYN1_9GAMM|nr:Protein of unknown function [Pseudoxanthomonas wuyuanensis]
MDAVDLARGIAVALMILSHGVNGLLPFDDFTDWGLVPVHAVTKVASTLFFIVFGVALGIAFVPKTNRPDWAQRRNRLLLRGLLILFWYKALTVIEMYGQHSRGEIADTLLYRDFPSYVEVLGFYAVALLWLPWLLPLWARTPAWLRWSSPLLLAGLSWWLLRHFDFWGVPQLQALLVEHPDYYTWGQLARGPLVLLGLLIGGLLLPRYRDAGQRIALAGALAAIGAVLLVLFQQLAGAGREEVLQSIARNAGKHPPELMFMLFSMGGALLLLALSLAGGQALARLLRPLTIIGTNALMAFIFHITVIFVLFRDALGYLHAVSYPYALALTLLLIAATSLWIWLWERMWAMWRRKR